MKKNISVVINTYNAAKYLSKVLNTAKDFDEIIVCDMESTDNTVKIATEGGAKVVTFPKANHKSAEPARTFAIQSASSDWVLVVDADELIPKTLHDYLYDFIENPGETRGLYIPRKNNIMGRFIPSLYPDYQLRFFIREGTEWPPYVHTFPKVKGKISHIPQNRKELAFEHLDDSTRSAVAKINDYTDNEVEKRTPKKVTLLNLMISPNWRFFKQYFIKGGFRYGIAGYIDAVRQSQYKFTMLCKMYEKQIGM